MIDARFLVTPQYLADHRGDLFDTRPRLVQHLGKDLPHLRHRDGRGFSPPTAAAPAAGNKGPTTTPACGAPTPPPSAPRNAPAPPPPCHPPATPRPGAAPHAPAPTPAAAPP